MRVAVLGEALIDLIRDADGAYRTHLGGSPYNLAVGLARQDIDVTYLSPFSDDQFGESLRQSLITEKVAIALERRSAWPTSLALVTVDNRGNPTYRLYREGIADKDTSYEEIADNVPDDTRVFHTGSLAITPSQLPKIRRLCALMRKRGVLISLDINIRLRASIDRKRYLEGVWSLLSQADIVKASDDDLAAFDLSGSPKDWARRACKEIRSSGLLVFTTGDGGASVFRSDETMSQRAHPVEALVDTVGAGDTFHAAFLASLLRGGEVGEVSFRPAALREALAFASAAAAINVSRKGCSPPTRSEVESFSAAVVASETTDGPGR